MLHQLGRRIAQLGDDRTQVIDQCGNQPPDHDAAADSSTGDFAGKGDITQNVR